MIRRSVDGTSSHRLLSRSVSLGAHLEYLVRTGTQQRGLKRATGKTRIGTLNLVGELTHDSNLQGFKVKMVYSDRNLKHPCIPRQTTDVWPLI